MIGELYEQALAGTTAPEIEHQDGPARPLPAHRWLRSAPGDDSVLDRCAGPTLAALAVLGGVGLAVLRRADPDRPWQGALVMTGAALAVATPSLLWYPMLLVALVALDGRAEWLALAAARYFTPSHPLPGVHLPDAGQLGYGAAVLVILAAWLIRRTRAATAPDAAAPEFAEPCGGDAAVISACTKVHVGEVRPGGAAAGPAWPGEPAPLVLNAAAVTGVTGVAAHVAAEVAAPGPAATWL